MNPAEPQIDWPRELARHRRWLATVLLARGVEHGALDEVMQEVQVAATTHGHRLRDPRKVAPWLYRVAATCSLQHRRRLGRNRRLLERYAFDRADQLSRSEPDPLDWLLADEQRRFVRQAIKSLPPPRRGIVVT